MSPRTRTWIARISAALLSATAAAGCASLPSSGSWMFARTAHFDILSRGAESPTRDLAEGMEKFRTIALRVLRIREEQLRNRVRIYALDRESFGRFCRDCSEGAFLLPGREWSYLVLDGSDLERSLIAARHAYVHALLRDASQTSGPAWYHEGWAELLSTSQIEADVLTLGRLPPGVGELLGRGQLPDLNSLLTASSNLRDATPGFSAFRVHAWAWMSLVQTGHAAGEPDRRSGLAEYLMRVQQGASVESAARQAFGSSVQDLDRALRAYVAASRLPILPLRVPNLPATTPLEIQAAEPVVVNNQLAELALALGTEHAKLACDLLERALAQAPQDPETQLRLVTARVLIGEATPDAYDTLTDPSFDALRIRRTREALELARLLRDPAPQKRDAVADRAQRAEEELGVDLSYVARLAGRGLSHTDLLRDDTEVIDALLEPTGPELVGAYREPRMSVSVPADGAQIRSKVALAEVAGRAGVGSVPRFDVVFVIDRSLSTLEQAGEGLTIFEAELEAAQRLISALDSRTSRVGVVMFADTAYVEYPLGDPAGALELVKRKQGVGDLTGTDLASAIEKGGEQLTRVPSLEPAQRRMLVLSDGDPNIPDSNRANRLARQQAKELAEFGVRIDAYALGASAGSRKSTFGKLAEVTRGDFVIVEQPSDIPNVLGNARLAGLAGIEIVNLTNQKPARAARVFSDGSYDGLVALEEGLNRIQVSAALDSGTSISRTITVYFERPVEPSPEERTQDAALLERVKARTAETAVIEEQRRARERATQTGKEKRTRALEVEVMDTPPEPSKPADAQPAAPAEP